MANHRGADRAGGRAVGTPNKITRIRREGIESVLKQMKFDPIAALIHVYNEALKVKDLPLARTCALDVASFTYSKMPQLEAIQIKADVRTTDDTAAALRGRLLGLASNCGKGILPDEPEPEGAGAPVVGLDILGAGQPAST